MTPNAVSKIASPRGTPGHELPIENRPGDDQRQELGEHEPAVNAGQEPGARRLRDAEKKPGAAALGPPGDGTFPLTHLKIGNPPAPASADGAPRPLGMRPFHW